MPEGLRAWLYLVRLSWLRQARSREMVWIALGLLALVTLLAAIQTIKGRWDPNNWYDARGVMTYAQCRDGLATTSLLLPWPDSSGAIQAALAEAARFLLKHAPIYRFSNFIFGVFVGFLLPIWTLCFATDTIGGERESGSLVWLLMRPLPRPAIYLAKYVAVLPWCLGMNLGGFAIICLAGGAPGKLALRLYWPSVFWGTLAFSALFLWMGTAFRRPAVVATVYSFFLETLFGNLPGYLKRASISFYTRCMMFEAGQSYDVQPEKPSIYLAVDGETALLVLLGLTIFLLVLGTFWFSRTEYVTAD
jgi:ABC-type transport system involved in multi-copper enzyme maturation permease subunit